MKNVDMNWLEENLFKRILSNHEQASLLAVLDVQHYQKGDILIAEGDTAQGLLLLYSGTLSLQYEKHGQPVRVGRLSAGAQVGDISLFNHEPANVTVKALEACEVYFYPKKASSP